MEPLWSPVVATGGNQRQIAQRRKPQKQAKSVASGCHGKEGVDGSSPSEGFQFLCSASGSVALAGGACGRWRPRGVLPDAQAAIARAYELMVLTLDEDRISAITWFGERSLFPHFGLPRSLPE